MRSGKDRALSEKTNAELKDAIRQGFSSEANLNHGQPKLQNAAAPTTVTNSVGKKVKVS